VQELVTFDEKEMVQYAQRSSLGSSMSFSVRGAPIQSQRSFTGKQKPDLPPPAAPVTVRALCVLGWSRVAVGLARQPQEETEPDLTFLGNTVQ